jgi:GDP-4-dehydro-6-deoxy-D-mannose reductase
MRVIMARTTLPNGLVLNVASGHPRRIRDLVRVLLDAADVPITVEVDPARIRATRVPRIIGNPDKAGDLLDWHPKTPFETTLLNTLSYWRHRT